MLGMFWMSDACYDNLTDGDPVSTAEFLRGNADSQEKQYDATVLLEHAVESYKMASTRPIGGFPLNSTERIRHRPQQQTVRGPPVFST